MKVMRADIERVAGVIETWQRRHVGQMDNDPSWSAQNLAIDLANAGEVTPLPAPYAQPVEPGDNAVWECPQSDEFIEATDDGEVVLPEGTVLDPDDAETMAAVLRAAAARARAMESARFGEPYPQPRPGE